MAVRIEADLLDDDPPELLLLVLGQIGVHAFPVSLQEAVYLFPARGGRGQGGLIRLQLIQLGHEACTVTLILIQGDQLVQVQLLQP